MGAWDEELEREGEMKEGRRVGSAGDLRRGRGKNAAAATTWGEKKRSEGAGELHT